MDTQMPKNEVCSQCQGKMHTDDFGRLYCPKCNKHTPPKDLYEEALFDLKDYQK